MAYDPLIEFPYHGFENRTDSAVAWSDAAPDRTFSVANTFNYYFQGVKVTSTGTKTVQIPNTIGLWYCYFYDITATATASQTFPSFYTSVLISVCYWNGTAALFNDERHGYRRNIEWHYWAHKTVGCRYDSGLSLTFTGTGATATFNLLTGKIFDEDIEFTIPSTTQCRVIYQNAPGTYTFLSALSTTLFKWNAATSRVQYVNSAASYALADCATNRYVNVWIFGTSDPYSGCYAFTETIAGTGTAISAANARIIPPPNISGFGLSPELRLLWRVVVRGDGVIQTAIAADDYRTYSSLPSGSVSATNASSIIFTPTVDILSTNVQAAIEELELDLTTLITNKDHGLLQGLLDDDHSQYFLLAGRTTDVIAYGSTVTGKKLSVIASSSTNGILELAGSASTGGTISILDPTTMTSITGPIFTLKRNDTTVTAADIIGEIDFSNNDTNNSASVIVGSIKCIAATTFASTHPDGYLSFGTSLAASGNAERFRVTSTGIIYTGTGTPAALTGALFNSYHTSNGVVQNNIQNLSNGASASCDWIATGDTGTDTTNYVDFGINSSGYSVAGWTINGALDGYLYSQSTNLSIGTVAAKYLNFFTGGSLIANERMRILSTGEVGIGVVAPLSILHVQTTTGAVLTLGRDDTVTAASDVIGQINFYSNDSSLTSSQIVGSIKCVGSAAFASANPVGYLTFGTSTTAAGNATRMTLDSLGNLLLGARVTAVDGITKRIQIEVGAEPTAAFTDAINIGAAVCTSSNLPQLAWYQGEGPAAVGTFTASHKIKVRINGTEYWIQLDAV